MRGWTIGLVIILLGSAGCALFQGRPGPSGGLASRGSNDVRPQNETGGALVGRGGARGPANGVLAGQVLDGFNQRRPGAVIHVSPVGGTTSDAPQQVVADEKGYFIIQGLKPGQSYKLEARTREHEEPIAGVTIAQPPNVVVVIKLTDEQKKLASDQSKRDPPKPNDKPDGYTYEPDRGPRLGPVPTPSQGSSPQTAPRLGRPDRVQETKEPEVPIKLDHTATDDQALRSAPPKASIPGPTPPGPVPFPTSTETNQDAPSAPEVRSLLDCPLLDLEGKTTTLHHYSGSLLLVDVWGTWCSACTKALPELAQWDQQYRDKGLKMVGVAYEDGAFATKAQRVAFVAQRSGIRYPMLLGQGDGCALLRLADVRRYPTLILLDAQGKIIWKGEGLTPENRHSLESILAERLK